VQQRGFEVIQLLVGCFQISAKNFTTGGNLAKGLGSLDRQPQQLDQDRISTRPRLMFVEENFWMLTAPGIAARAIFPDDDPESHASAAVIVLTLFAQLQHLVT
jgi:hypothetical protein